MKQFILNAASIAERQTSAQKAISSAWSALHAQDSALMLAAFKSWCKSEGMTEFTSGYDISSLGELLRRRYKTVSEVVASLRKASANI